jgi:hypothetical protein
MWAGTSTSCPPFRGRRGNLESLGVNDFAQIEIHPAFILRTGSEGKSASQGRPFYVGLGSGCQRGGLK